MLASSIDLAPTILAACGVDVPPEMTGVNLVEIGRTGQIDRRTLFGEGFAHDVADIDTPRESLLFRWCIHDRWKLIIPHVGQVGRYAAVHRVHREEGAQLFNLQSDPHETRNLAQQRPELVARLNEQVDHWWKP